jgi:hypothetical protein
LTGYARASLKERGAWKGLGTCVAKPLAEDELHAVIEIALKNGRRMLEWRKASWTDIGGAC